MKKMLLYTAIAIMTAQAIQGQPSLDQQDRRGHAALIQQIGEKREQLRRLILSSPETRELVTSLEAVQQRIHALENRAGISDLQRKVAQLRLESCQLQQQPEIQNILTRIQEIAGRVNEKTRPEQERIKQLLQTGRGDQSDRQTIQSRIKEIERSMKSKVTAELEEINALNEEIFNKEQIKRQLNRARPIQRALVERYKSIANTLDPLDEELSELLGNINERLQSKNDKLKQVRQQLRELNNQMKDIDPCFAAKENPLDPHWDVFFL